MANCPVGWMDCLYKHAKPRMDTCTLKGEAQNMCFSSGGSLKRTHETAATAKGLTRQSRQFQVNTGHVHAY